MKWIQLLLDNVWAVVIIAGVLGQLFQAIAKRKGDDAAPAQRPEYEFEDPDLAARTRKIRDEIQRKIAERQRGHVPDPEPAALEPPPLVREVVVQTSEPVSAPVVGRVQSQREAEILEQQVALAERLQELQVMKEAAAKRTEFESATADHAAEIRTATRHTVVEDLRTPAALRRAFILSEVLGPPVGLRR